MPVFRIFQDLTKSEINEIFDMGLIRPIDGGHVLFNKGDEGREMYVILTGRICVADELGANYNIVAELGPGEILGEIAMFDETHRRTVHAFAKEPTQVLVISEETLKKFIGKKIPKQFLVNIIHTLCHRLGAANAMIMEAKFGKESAGEVGSSG